MSLPFRSLFIKYLLFIFNLIFVLSGIILIIVGSVIQASYKDYDPVLDESFFSVPVLLIVIGTIIFVVSFFGCCGAYKENYCLTISFCISLILIFILELSGGIAGYVLRDRVSKVLESEFQASMLKYETSVPIKNMWDEIHTSLKCCGIGPNITWIDSSHKLPNSCCENSLANCTSNIAYTTNCKTKLADLLQRYAAILGGVGVGIAVIQLLGIIFACNLASSIKDYESV